MVVGPIVWQAVREARARQHAAENLRQIQGALEQYQAREQGKHIAEPEATDHAARGVAPRWGFTTVRGFGKT